MALLIEATLAWTTLVCRCPPELSIAAYEHPPLREWGKDQGFLDGFLDVWEDACGEAIWETGVLREDDLIVRVQALLTSSGMRTAITIYREEDFDDE